MSTRLTLFTATLVQDSDLSISGVDRESSADQPFTLVDGVPTISGRSLKGAAVAMARRFFNPLPQSISEEAGKDSAYRRSAWEFANATPEISEVRPRLRAGVGIRHKTGARARGVLYDREVIPAGTQWPLVFRVDWLIANNEAVEAEGILGYVLQNHWSAGRCWLGGGVARGLGWCHTTNLQVFRFGPDEYDEWVKSGRVKLPETSSEVPLVEPTQSWCLRTLDLKLSFGEYRPVADEPPWGLDMLAIGRHDSERAVQETGRDGTWATPSWASANDPLEALSTDRAILMDRGRPLLPGSSVRGPLRHAFSRLKTAAGHSVEDPHLVEGNVSEQDPAGRVFDTVARSSRILIRDARAEEGWTAARLHMHAEDEFTAGSYGSAKRDAVRLLSGVFPIRIVAEGPDAESVEPLTKEIDRLVALGELGHLPIGGHKTRGAGWGRWQAAPWSVDDVHKLRSWAPLKQGAERDSLTSAAHSTRGVPVPAERCGNNGEATHVRVTAGVLNSAEPTLGEAALRAQEALGNRSLEAWWCEPAIDLAVTEPPTVFGRNWPEGGAIRIEEASFYSDHAVWRIARTGVGSRWVLIEEVGNDEPGSVPASIVHTPARLHGSSRFAAAKTNKGAVCLREWHVDGQILGFTIVPEVR
jgi:hypothetical protein